MRTIILCCLSTVLAPAAEPVFTRDIAPILNKHCVQCHRPDDIAPMSLLDYKSARPWAKSIRQAVTARTMPPWFADAAFKHFSNDPRLTPEEIRTVQVWVDGGAREGDPRDLPKPPVFTPGWQLGKPDIVIDIGEDHVVTPGEDAYEHFVVPSNLKEGVWIRAAEIKPGNRQVVHHVHVLLVQESLQAMPASSTLNMPGLSDFLVRDGKLTRIRMDSPVVNDACASDAPALPYLTGFQEGGLAAFLPGRPPDVFEEGTAKWVPAGAKLEFVIHYAPTKGKPKPDRTSIGLFLAPGPPKRELHRMDLRNFFMSIPAGAANHEVRRCHTFDRDTMLLSITPHMHYRGKDVKYELEHAGGRRETLLSVPRYDFNWQLVYRLKNPIMAEKGSRIVVTAHYDNSANNRANPDPKSVIRWGDKSEEEMMTSWIEYLDASPMADKLSSSR